MNEVQILTVNPLMENPGEKADHYARPSLAADLARSLVQGTGFLDLGPKGVLLCGYEGTGKTKFVRQDVCGFLKDEISQAIPIYVALGKNSSIAPSKSVKTAVVNAVSDNSHVFSRFKERLSQAMRFKMGLRLKAGTDSLGGEIELSAEAREQEARRDCDMVREMLVDLHQKTGKTVVMVIDGVEECLATKDGAMMLQAINDAKDSVNADGQSRVGMTNIYVTSLAGNIDELVGPNEILERMPVRQLPPLDLRFIRHFFEKRLSFISPDQMPSDTVLRACFSALDRNARAFSEVMDDALRTKDATSLSDAVEMATQKYLEFETTRISKALGPHPDPTALAVLVHLSMRTDFSPLLNDVNVAEMTFLHNAIVSKDTELAGQARHPVKSLNKTDIENALSQLNKVGLVWSSYNGMHLINNPQVASWVSDNALLQNLAMAPIEQDAGFADSEPGSLTDTFWTSDDVVVVDDSHYSERFH